MLDEVSLESTIYGNLKRCLELRQRYMDYSLQEKDYTSMPLPLIEGEGSEEPILSEEAKLLKLPSDPDTLRYAGLSSASTELSSDVEMIVDYGQALAQNPPPPLPEMTYEFKEGVAVVMSNKTTPILACPITLTDFLSDLDFLWHTVSADGPSKSFCFRRLRFLQHQWQLYQLMNEGAELAEQRRVPHRDFYNVHKVDTHVHHSASMNCKHMLRFIKSKLRRNGDDMVIHRDGRLLTLKEVFQSLNLTAYDLSIDHLDMHAHKDAFHRFDRFNAKYNPIGETRLREIFLKTDNLIKGSYLAELTKQVFDDLEASKYQLAEYRLSIYGRSADEWDKLAAWVLGNKLASPSVRWMIQFPRLYHIYRSSGAVDTFQTYLVNMFKRLFEVTIDPSSNLQLYHLTTLISGFDTVDDESRPEMRIDAKSSTKPVSTPDTWDKPINPPYSYYLYYIWANLAVLNQLRAMRSLPPLAFRPHSGEAGDPEHLASAFLTAQGINHGLLLRKAPVLQYLYYLAQIHISMSPLSNNALFLPYDRNPFPDYFARGLHVTLSTDDPLQFHYTREPLIEEYSVAAQIWKLGSGDMCEIARNSVLASGFPLKIKEIWLGHGGCVNGTKAGTNHMDKTNVPDIRVAFRQRMHQSELGAVYYNAGDLSESGVNSDRTKATSTSTKGINATPPTEMQSNLTGTPPLSSNGSVNRRTSVHDIAMIAETQLMDEDFYNQPVEEEIGHQQNSSSIISSPKQTRKRSKGDINNK